MAEWRQIEGFPQFEVSDEGALRHRDTREPIPTKIGVNGYLRVTLPGTGDGRSKMIHQLVARAFLGQRPDGMVTRHLNGDASDARLSNLAYGTQSENMRDRIAHGTDPWSSRTHCANGHEYTPENIYHPPGRTVRVCRACNGSGPKPPGVVRSYGTGSITRRKNGLWVGRIEMGTNPETGKRKQRVFTSMDKDVVLAKLASARVSA